MYLLVRGGALDHVEVLEREAGAGMWLSDRAVGLTGLHAGDFATVGASRVRVVGVYRDLSGTTVDRFWCSNGNLLLVSGPDLIAPPPLVLVDRSTLAEVMLGIERITAEGAWEAGLQPDLTMDEVDELIGDLACRGDADLLAWCAGDERPLVPGTQAGPFGDQSVEALDEAEFVASLPGVEHAVRGRSGACHPDLGRRWHLGDAALAALAGPGSWPRPRRCGSTADDAR